MLYKVFSKVVDGRVGPVMEAAQTVDQAGFRSGFSCDEHLFTVAQLAERADESKVPLWVAAVDFRKAFDCVEHACTWDALRKQLRASVRTDESHATVWAEVASLTQAR